MARRKGVQVTAYFEAETADKLVRYTENTGMSLQDLIRIAVKSYVANETVTEVEKLQIFNLRAFKFLANKMAHIELLSAVLKVESKKSVANYDEILASIKNFNQQTINEIIEETL